MKNHFVLLVFVLMTFLLFSCKKEITESYPEEMKIGDFAEFETLTETPKKIIVTLSDPHNVTFEITKEEQISEVVDVLFNKTTYIPTASNEFNTSPKTLVFVNEEENESCPLNIDRVKYKEKYYVPSYEPGSKTLWAVIYNIALENGAIKSFEPIDYHETLTSISSFSGFSVFKYPSKIVVTLREPYNLVFEITETKHIERISNILYNETVYTLSDSTHFAPDASEICFVSQSGEIGDTIGTTALKYYEKYYTYEFKNETLSQIIFEIAKELEIID